MTMPDINTAANAPVLSFFKQVDFFSGGITLSVSFDLFGDVIINNAYHPVTQYRIIIVITVLYVRSVQICKKKNKSTGENKTIYIIIY